ncbi:MAG: hypothetical protein IJ025_04810 [Clostridia bacterium]|nr:hypothetical protein [Clostridia bacterium]
MLKKGLSVILSIVLICSVFSATVGAAVNFNGDISAYPVIMVAGYSSSELVRVDENGERTRIWGLDMDSVLNRVINRIYDLGKGLVLTAKGDAEYLGRTLGEEIEAELEYMKINPNGTSKYNIQVENTAIEETNMAYILENNLPLEYINEDKISYEIAEYIGEENMFFYTNDWRQSVYDCAIGLDEYIQQVKEYTGKDKVNIIAVSHGGQVSAVYLSLFGYKQDVDNAVLTVPAIGGAGLALDLMTGDVAIDEYMIVHYLEHGFDADGKYEWLLEAQQLGFLDEVVKNALPYIYNVAGYWGSIWDFIPLEYYEELKAERLDPVESAAIIEKTDMVHFDIMANFRTNLQKCVNDYGINISIIAGTDVPCVSGLRTNGDALIRTTDSTGALCAPYGERFNDGYTGAGTMCDNPSHDHVSPSFEVDASTAYLPENTWYIDGLFHGMTFHDPYSRTLALKNLLTDEIVNVHSHPDYPQFHASTNTNYAVSVRFDKSGEGLVSSQDDYLIIKNLSQNYPVKITSVTFAGADLVAYTMGMKALEPGKEIKIQVTGKIPQVSNALMQVKVNYEMVDNTTSLIGERACSFKIMNGPSVVYDEETPFVNADYVIGFKNVIDEDTKDALTNTGVLNIVSFVYEWIMALLDQLGIGLLLK